MKHFFACLRCRLLLVFMLAVSSVAVANDDDAKALFYYSRSLIDSLKQQLNTQPLTDKQKMETYAEIANNYHDFEMDSAIWYMAKSIALAQELNDREMLIQYHLSIGIFNGFKGNYDAALVHINQSKDLAVEQGNLRMETSVIAIFGFVYTQQGMYHTAMDHYLQHLKITESEGWIESHIGSLANLSEINRRLGNTEIAFQYLKQAEEKSNQLNDFYYRWIMPQVYNEYAYIYLSKGDYDEAFRNALIADSLCFDVGTINLCYTKSLLASIYLHWNDYDHALHYAKESYRYADILKDVTLYINAGKILSDVYLAQKRYREAEAEALKAWQIDTTNIDASRDLVHNLALANMYMGHTEQAAYYLKKYADMNAQYTDKSFHTTVSDLAIKYETEKKEERIALLERERNLLETERRLYAGLGVSGILLAALLGIVLAQNKRNARKQRRLIAAESLQAGEIGERARIAEDLHDRLGGSLSAARIGLKNAENLQIIGEKIDDCIREVREITNNIMPRSLRLFGIKGALEDLCVQFLNVRFHFFGDDRRVRYNLEYAMYCCARELVSNAQKHSGAEHIDVQLVQGKKHLSLTVADDGCGFDEKNIVKGDGLQNVRNRVASCRGKLDISSSPGRGTETVIELRSV